MVYSILARRLVLAALAAVLALPGFATANEAWDGLHYSVLKSAAMVLTNTSSGSAFVVDTKENLIITHYQVVRGHEQVAVLFPWYEEGKLITDMKFYLEKGQATKGKVIFTNRRLGLALIQVEKIPDSLVPVTMATEEAVVGESLYTVAFDFQKNAPFTMTEHKVTKAAEGDTFLQGLGMIAGRTITVDVPFQPGNGGGPVVNDAGELVGVSIGGVAPEAQGIVIHGGDAKKAIVEQLMKLAQQNPEPAAAPVQQEVTPPATQEEVPMIEEAPQEEGVNGLEEGIQMGVEEEGTTEEMTEEQTEDEEEAPADPKSEGVTR